MGVELALEGVEVRRAERTVLSVPVLSIPAGEVLAVMGPNGAGKSTLLHVLAGLLSPARGLARIGGAPADRIEPRRRLSLLPQDSPLFSGTVFANVELPLRLRRIPSAPDRERRVDAALEMTGAASLKGRAAHALSGGEARRVAIARALVSQPEALLLDEPYAALDSEVRSTLSRALASYAREHEMTLVIVTQDADDVRIADRVLVVRDGQIQPPA